MNNLNDEFLLLSLLKIFMDFDASKWNEMRNIAAYDICDVRIEKYFADLFNNKIPKYIFAEGSDVFRARPITNENKGELSYDYEKIIDEFYGALLCEEDIKNLNNCFGHSIPKEDLFYLKCSQTKGFSQAAIKEFSAIQRKYSKSDYYGFSASGSGCPPKEKRSAGRLNTIEDSFLYVSLEKDTAVYEMRPHIQQNFSVARAITKKDLLLANLRDISTDFSLAHFSLNSILGKISEPNIEQNHLFYHITQALSHFVRKNNYDGILYRSALKKDGTNLVLFDENCVDFVSSDVITIKDLMVEISTILPLNED